VQLFTEIPWGYTLSRLIMNPLSIIRDFYRGLPDDVKSMMSHFTLSRLTEFDLLGDGAEQMEEYLKQDDTLRDLGTVLSIRAAIDFVFLIQGDKEHWDKAINWQLDMVDDGRIRSSMRDTLHRNLPLLPDRKQRWLQAFESWKKIRDSDLSDDSLLLWDDRFLSERPTE
jgi:hypothetical protein